VNHKATRWILTVVDNNEVTKRRSYRVRAAAAVPVIVTACILVDCSDPGTGIWIVTLNNSQKVSTLL